MKLSCPLLIMQWLSCSWWHGSGSSCCDWSNHGRMHHVLEKRGWLRPQRRWGFFMHFSLLYCDSFFWCLCEGVKLSVPCFFPLYSSLGISPLEGAQWYASSRRFSHASLLANYLSILCIKNCCHSYIQILKRNYCSWNFDSAWQDAIQFDADLVANNERSLETLVSVGMTLGVSTRNKGLQYLQKFSLGWQNVSFSCFILRYGSSRTGEE